MTRESLMASFSKSLVILNVAVMFLAAQAVNAQSLFERSLINECKVGCLSSHRGDRKEAERACSYVCWCMVTEKGNKEGTKTVEDGQAICVSQYNTMGDDKNSLSKRLLEWVVCLQRARQELT